MIIHNKLDNYFVFSADRQTFLGFEMTANLHDTSPLRMHVLPAEQINPFGLRTFIVGKKNIQESSKHALQENIEVNY